MYKKIIICSMVLLTSLLLGQSTVFAKTDLQPKVSALTERLFVDAGHFKQVTQAELIQKTSNDMLTALSAGDDSFSTSTTIAPNSSIYGSLTSDSDVNYYKFTLDSTGYIQLNFRHDIINSTSSYWEAFIYNSAYEEIASQKFNGRTVSSSMPQIGLPVGTYYIKITDYYFSDLAYNFTVNYTQSSLWESEFNDSFQTTDSISLNTTNYGSIKNDADNDYYKFTLKSSGYIQLNFRHDIMDSTSSYWEVFIYNSAYEEMTSQRFNGRTVSSSMPQIGLPAGTYYVRVRDYYFSDMTYNFLVNYTQSSVWENEFNDSFQSADSILVDTAYYGSIREESDNDYYKFTLKSPGHIQLVFRHDIMDSSSSYWDTKIYNSTYEEIVTQRFNGKTVSSSTPQIGLPAGTYYVRISDYSYSNLTYNFSVKYIKSSRWETEFNDSFQTADAVALNTTYSGGMRNDSDIDYYKIVLPVKKSVNFKLSHNIIDNSSTYWRLYIYNASYQELIRYDFSGDKKSQATVYQSLKAGTYFIKIMPYYYSANTYKMVISENIPLTAPKNLKASSVSYNQIKLIWSKTSGASGYYIYRATSKLGKYRKIKTLGRNNTIYTDRLLTTGKSYYYKIIAYKTQAGKTTRKDSSIVSAKPKVAKPKNLKARAVTNKKIVLTWGKPAGASGYRIYMTTSNKGKYKLVKTIRSGNICRWAYGSLKKMRTYYYKVVPFRTVSRKKVNGVTAGPIVISTKR